jgi:small conductance mechanosensitive channel
MDSATVSGATKAAADATKDLPRNLPTLSEKAYAWFTNQGLEIIIVIVVAIVFYKLLSLFIKHTVSILKRNPFMSAEQAHQRAETIATVMSAIIRFFVFFIAGIVILNIIYPPSVAAVLASASVLGVALGFGAQTLVRDLIAGFFILFENQYCVGERVQIGSSKGTVEHLSLRITLLRDFEGKIHTIPNSDIRTVINESRGWSRSVVDVGVQTSHNTNEVIKIINDGLSRIKLTGDIKSAIIENPSVSGVESFNEKASIIRITAQAQSGYQDELARLIRSSVQSELLKNSIEITMI